LDFWKKKKTALQIRLKVWNEACDCALFMVSGHDWLTWKAELWLQMKGIGTSC
jgi:hypothetical protein